MATIKDQGTVCFFVKDKKVMLILIDYDQADGFGGQKWTGPGGHLDEGETPKVGAIREIKEEVGVEVEENDLREIELIKGENGINLHIFIVTKWNREPKPVDPTIKEIKWFNPDEIRYDQMHEGNIDWLPKILNSI